MKDLMTTVKLVRVLESNTLPGSEKLKLIGDARDDGRITKEEAHDLIHEYFKTPEDIVDARFPEPESHTYCIAETVFDIMDAMIYYDKDKEFRNHPDFAEDSRNLFQTILQWAYEFNADWLIRDEEDCWNYIGEAEEFATKKMQDYLDENPVYEDDEEEEEEAE